LTNEECLESLQTMAPNKSPGSDGLPAEFYKVFWEDIKQFLLHCKCLEFCIRKGLFINHAEERTYYPRAPEEQTRQSLKKLEANYSPELCDYKIAAKSIANRTKKILPKFIINNDQTGFLKDRFIGENIRLIDSIINYTNTEQIPGLLLFIDFEKAINTIEWSFIEKH